MSRLKDIRNKLQYAEHQRQVLMNLLFDSKKEKKEPMFTVHIVADILSSSRECYDYCARDILEEKIIAHTSDQKLLAQYNKGNLKAYFPFYENELSNPNNPFSELATTDPALHCYLVDMSRNIAADNNIPNTSFKYGDMIRLKDLVNEKKHDCLIAIETNENQEILIESPSIKILIPIKEQRGWNRFQVTSDSDLSRVVEFRLEYLDEEAGKFCMFATVSTRIVLEDIYTKFFK